MNKVRYSIIIPIFNGMPYLEAAVNSILSSGFADFELILSDDHSTDGSSEFCKQVQDPRVKFIQTESELSLSEHWEWALSHAKGDWIMFLGQDDGVQGYFFDLAERLTHQAEVSEIGAICARRAYMFWPGCESEYKSRLHYYAWDKTSFRNSTLDLIRTLFFGRSYHELPQMYTNSLFHTDLISKAKVAQGGRVFITHPQDSNLAAIALVYEKKYIRSEIPLGWVGTSPSSAGLAISRVTSTGENTSNLASVYSEKIRKSSIKYPKKAGDFEFGDNTLYFWQSYLSVASIRKGIGVKFFSSKVFTLFLFAIIWARTLTKEQRLSKHLMFVNLLRENNLTHTSVVVLAGFLRWPILISRRLKEALAQQVTNRKDLMRNTVRGFHRNSAELNEFDLIEFNKFVVRNFYSSFNSN